MRVHKLASNWLQLAVLAGATFISGPVAAQEICTPSESSGLTVYGPAAAQPLHITTETLRRLPMVRLTGHNHDGIATEFEGVRLMDVLIRAGAPTGSDLRGRANQIFVRVEAADGYAAVVALAEADTSFRTSVPVLAMIKDGAELGAHEGPLQLIVPDDRRHGRWVRQVRCLRLMSAADASPGEGDG